MIGKMGRAVAAAGLALAGLAASFNGAAAAPSDILSLAPSCTARNGKPVVYQNVSASFLQQRGNFLLGMATSERGQPTIYYDAATLARMPAEFVSFIFFHECAHHQLGHVNGRGGNNRELAADCQAVKWLVQHKNYGQREVSVITGYFNRHFPNPGDPPYYPPMTERMDKLQACYELNRR